MKVSIITVVFNAQSTIAGAIASVASQSYPDVEHIVIDGGSSDDTLKVINEHVDLIAHIVSEPDNGIYDAMNKGIKLASGDVIGLLNADDVYEHENVISEAVNLLEDAELDACYADLVYVKAEDLSQVTRYWRSKKHEKGLCFKGWMPAHPTLFLKRQVYDKVGLFNTELDYQADLEFCVRAYWGAYSIAYAGLEAQMEIWAQELEKISNVKVNSIDPGPVRTSFRRRSHPGESQESLPTPQSITSAYLKILSGQHSFHGIRLNV